MKALSLIGAVLTTCASSGGLVMKNKITPKRENETQESVDLNYYKKVYEQTNIVYSDYDLIQGNYYKVNFYNSTYDAYLDDVFSDGEYLNFVDVRFISFDTWDFDESLLFNSDVDYYSTLYIDINISYFSIYFNFNDDVYSAYNLTFDVDNYFIAKLDQFAINDLDHDWYSNFFEECPQEYLPYHYERVVSNSNLYGVIYDFFYHLLVGNQLDDYHLEIMGVNTSMTSWLAHTFTIILLILGVVWLILVVRWIFKVCSGLIKV